MNSMSLAAVLSRIYRLNGNCFAVSPSGASVHLSVLQPRVVFAQLVLH